jgi:hypothetical protein
MERILEHWRDLDHREPTLKIVCPYDYSRKRFGLFPDGCPNLLWELMRTRREQLTASQLMRKNPTEAIVDKDNHLRDALKYILLSLPSPSEKHPAKNGRGSSRRHSHQGTTPHLEFAWRSTMPSIGKGRSQCLTERVGHRAHFAIVPNWSGSLQNVWRRNQRTVTNRRKS